VYETQLSVFGFGRILKLLVPNLEARTALLLLALRNGQEAVELVLWLRKDLFLQ